jgi:hypothetical protein
MDRDYREETSGSQDKSLLIDPLRSHRSEHGDDLEVEKPLPLGICLVDGIEMGE